MHISTPEANYPKNNKQKLLFVWIFLLITWIITTLGPPIFKDRTGRLISDYFDRTVYFERGKWLTEGTSPKSEYPQIPTLLFGMNHLITKGLDPNFQLPVYTAIFSLEMLIVLFLLFKLLLELLPPSHSNYAYLLLLPPTLYFTYNRFDILPVFFCIWAYSAVTKKNWGLASIILAIATFTKWYPVLLFPGFFIYASTHEAKFQWNMILAFTLTSCSIVLLSFLSGGVDSILAPYQFHIARDGEFLGLPVLFSNLLGSLTAHQDSLSIFYFSFFLIQVSGPILIFFIKLDSLEALIHYSILVTGIFIIFSRIWSPQWYLWLIPFLIISAKNIRTATLIIVYNLITYLSFPLFYDHFGSTSYWLKITGILIYIIIFGFMYLSFKKLILRSKLLPVR